MAGRSASAILRTHLGCALQPKWADLMVGFVVRIGGGGPKEERLGPPPCRSRRTRSTPNENQPVGKHTPQPFATSTKKIRSRCPAHGSAEMGLLRLVRGLNLPVPSNSNLLHHWRDSLT